MAQDLEKIFESINNIKIGVIGDVMLDTYMWGRTERISPEAPVPIVSLHKREYRIGGAGNVALNCRSLGSNVAILAVVGDDEAATTLQKMFRQEGISTDYLVKSKDRITTNKTRIISRNQQMMRLDEEITRDLDGKEESNLLEKVSEYIRNEKPAAIILEDYNKGVLSGKVISEIIALCQKHKVITAVDPKRKNFFNYKGVDIFKPNLKEVREGLNLLFDEVDLPLLKNIHHELQRVMEHKISLITLSEKGVFYQEEKDAKLIPSHLRNIADVSGAGDTVIAVAALVYAATKDIAVTAEIANIAGGLVCEEVGTVAIRKEKLLSESKTLLA